MQIVSQVCSFHSGTLMRRQPPELLSKYFTYFQYPGPQQRPGSHFKCPLFQLTYWKHAYISYDTGIQYSLRCGGKKRGVFLAYIKISLKFVSIFAWRKNQRTLALCTLNHHASINLHVHFYVPTSPTYHSGPTKITNICNQALFYLHHLHGHWWLKNND